MVSLEYLAATIHPQHLLLLDNGRHYMIFVMQSLLPLHGLLRFLGRWQVPVGVLTFYVVWHGSSLPFLVMLLFPAARGYPCSVYCS